VEFSAGATGDAGRKRFRVAVAGYVDCAVPEISIPGPLQGGVSVDP